MVGLDLIHGHQIMREVGVEAQVCVILLALCVLPLCCVI